VEIAGSPAATVTAGTAYRFEPTLLQGGGTVAFSIGGKPSWATFSTTTGTLSGTPGTSNEGTSALITITASNGTSSASLAPFTIQVTAPIAPTTGSAQLSWGAPKTNANGTEITELAGYHIYYGTSDSVLQEKITITSPNVTTYLIQGLKPGTYYFSVVAYNSLGVDSAESNVASKIII
jgi:hypothetical protein